VPGVHAPETYGAIVAIGAVVTFQEMTLKMTKSNIRFLSFSSLSLFVALAPLACGSDDDDTNSGTAGQSAGGSSSTAGKSSTTAGKSGGGSSNKGGSANLGGVGTSGEDATGGEAGAPAATTARLRVVHASPNAPSVDIYAKGSSTAVAKGVGYGQATAFIEVDAGTVAFDLRAAGAKVTVDPAFTTDDIAVDAGADYTLVAAGDFDHPGDATVAFRVLALEHDFDAATAGTALARVVHATPAWANVDLDIAATDGVDLPGLAAFESESNVALPAGVTVPLDFQTDTDGVLSQLTLPKLTAGNELFVIATGNPGFPFRAPANGFALLVVDQDGKVSWVKELPWLHMVHASDISTVDVYESTHATADAKLSDNLAAQKMTAFQLPASATGFTLKAVAGDAASGTATGLATGATSTIEAGEHYLSYIAGNTIQTIHEQFDLLQPTKAMLRGVHASVSVAQTVDFGAVVTGAVSTVLVNGVMPAESSAEAGVAIAPGNVILGAAAHSTTVPLAQKPLTGGAGAAAPSAGERDFALLVGTDGLWVVDTSVAGWPLR
jgi:Domain of unknown function (DUF4397)